MEESLPKEQSNCFRHAALRTRLGTELIPVRANMRPAAIGAKQPLTCKAGEAPCYGWTYPISEKGFPVICIRGSGEKPLPRSVFSFMPRLQAPKFAVFAVKFPVCRESV